MVYLVDYPAVSTTVTFTVTIVQCLVLDFDLSPPYSQSFYLFHPAITFSHVAS